MIETGIGPIEEGEKAPEPGVRPGTRNDGPVAGVIAWVPPHGKPLPLVALRLEAGGRRKDRRFAAKRPKRLHQPAEINLGTSGRIREKISRRLDDPDHLSTANARSMASASARALWRAEVSSKTLQSTRSAA